MFCSLLTDGHYTRQAGLPFYSLFCFLSIKAEINVEFEDPFYLLLVHTVAYFMTFHLKNTNL